MTAPRQHASERPTALAKCGRVPLTKNERILLEGLRSNLSDAAGRLEQLAEQFALPEIGARGVLERPETAESPELFDAILRASTLLSVLVPELRKHGAATREVARGIREVLQRDGT